MPRRTFSRQSGNQARATYRRTARRGISRDGLHGSGFDSLPSRYRENAVTRKLNAPGAHLHSNLDSVLAILQARAIVPDSPV